MFDEGKKKKQTQILFTSQRLELNMKFAGRPYLNGFKRKWHLSEKRRCTLLFYHLSCTNPIRFHAFESIANTTIIAMLNGEIWNLHYHSNFKCIHLFQWQKVLLLLSVDSIVRRVCHFAYDQTLFLLPFIV